TCLCLNAYGYEMSKSAFRSNSLLDFYEPFDRSCPIYAGFNSFVTISHGNLRHILEICYKIFIQVQDFNHKLPKEIDPLMQAEGVKEASRYLLEKVKDCGDEGNRLYDFVNRLGHLYSINRRSKIKSRTEIIQFSIIGGTYKNKNKIMDFINESIKHSILLDFQGNQRFDQNNPDLINYVLNPIFSPYFMISYRKKRRLDLRAEQLEILVDGTEDDYKKLASLFSEESTLADENQLEFKFSENNDN
ncbi:hypothetical protein, partial [Leptospira levettii]|uniref:ORC-CDC6 family AAA ATPase n=1 Tax=Leptospira levettii TaxID=2023178 RepID=UPI001AEF4D86